MTHMTVSWREYVDSRFEAADKAVAAALAAQEKAVAAALAAADRAVTKAELANEKRLENTNEWRATYGDLVTRREAQSKGTTAGWGYVLGFGGLAIGVVGIVLAVSR